MCAVRQVGSAWRPDGPVRYRVDPVSGDRIGILPRSCKWRRHSMAAPPDGTGYDHRVLGDSVGDGPLLQLTCRACAAANDPDATWSLVLSGPPPVRAELDDGAYADARPHFQQERIRRD